MLACYFEALHKHGHEMAPRHIILVLCSITSFKYSSKHPSTHLLPLYPNAWANSAGFFPCGQAAAVLRAPTGWQTHSSPYLYPGKVISVACIFPHSWKRPQDTSIHLLEGRDSPQTWSKQQQTKQVFCCCGWFQKGEISRIILPLVSYKLWQVINNISVHCLTKGNTNILGWCSVWSQHFITSFSVKK